MRVNVYAEEMTEKVEIIEKTTPDGTFTGVRFYLELPATVPVFSDGVNTGMLENVSGPFMHHKDDNDSAAVTFWGKGQLRNVLAIALQKLDQHYINKKKSTEKVAEKRSCNRHNDCDVAEQEAKLRNPGKDLHVDFHCHNDECEECFGN